VQLLIPPEKRAFYEMMWKNILEPGKLQMKTRGMRLACCIPKASNAQSEYVMRIAFTLKQCLHERSSMLLYSYFASLLIFKRYMSPFIIDQRG
jgi:hypothetical protein